MACSRTVGASLLVLVPIDRPRELREHSQNAGHRRTALHVYAARARWREGDLIALAARSLVAAAGYLRRFPGPKAQRAAELFGEGGQHSRKEAGQHEPMARSDRQPAGGFGDRDFRCYQIPGEHRQQNMGSRKNSIENSPDPTGRNTGGARSRPSARAN
jgi:hypothetical protein